MMDPGQPVFAEIDSSDDRLVHEIERILGVTLPQQCTQGVALNARLLQKHADILRAVTR
jgi:hypothetical protein